MATTVEQLTPAYYGGSHDNLNVSDDVTATEIAALEAAVTDQLHTEEITPPEQPRTLRDRALDLYFSLGAGFSTSFYYRSRQGLEKSVSKLMEREGLDEDAAYEVAIDKRIKRTARALWIGALGYTLYRLTGTAEAIAQPVNLTPIHGHIPAINTHGVVDANTYESATPVNYHNQVPAIDMDKIDTPTSGQHQHATPVAVTHPTKEEFDTAKYEQATPVDHTTPIDEWKFSKKVRTIDPSEGWFKTMREMGITDEKDQKDLLEASGKWLEGHKYAYKAPELGGYGMNMSDDGKLDKEAIVYLAKKADKLGIHTYFSHYLNGTPAIDADSMAGNSTYEQATPVHHADTHSAIDTDTSSKASDYEVATLVHHSNDSTAAIELGDSQHSDISSSRYEEAQPVAETHISEAARTIHVGEGFYETFTDLKIDAKYHHALLKEVGPWMVAHGYGYKDDSVTVGGYGLYLHDGKLPDAAINHILDVANDKNIPTGIHHATPSIVFDGAHYQSRAGIYEEATPVYHTGGYYTPAIDLSHTSSGDVHQAATPVNGQTAAIGFQSRHFNGHEYSIANVADTRNDGAKAYQSVLKDLKVKEVDWQDVIQKSAQKMYDKNIRLDGQVVVHKENGKLVLEGIDGKLPPKIADIFKAVVEQK